MSSGCSGRFNQHIQRIVHPETNLAATKAHDAGVSRPKHLDYCVPPKAELFEAMDVFRLP